MELLRIVSDNPSIVWANGKTVDERIDANYYHVNHIKSSKTEVSMFRISKYCSLSKQKFNPNKHDEDYFKYIDISNVDINTGVTEYQLVNRSEAPSRAKKKVCKNDIIVSTVRPNRNAVSIINTEDDELVVSTGFAVIQCKEGIDNYYLFAALKTNNIINQLVRKTSGGLYPAISEKDIMDIEIPIPSSEIQKFIGDKVRKAEKLIEEAKRLKEEAEEILLDNLSFTIEDFHKKNHNKCVWVGNVFLYERIDCQYYDALYEYIEKKLKKNKCIALIDLCTDYSITVPYSTDFGRRSNNNIYPMYRVKNINDYIVNTEDLVFMNCKYYNSNENCRVFAGDILLSRVGSIGRACIYLDNKNASMGQNVTRIRLKDNINKYYFLCYINSQISRLLMQRETNAGLQSNITNENIKQLMIPILERSIQDEIGNKILKYIQISNQIKQLMKEAKKDVEDLIEGNFDMSKVKKDL